MSPLTDRSQRGFTLAEAMIVIVLSGVVTIGLIGFYLSSQATWIDGSNQALTQREGTLLIEAIAEKTRDAASFAITIQDPKHCSVSLYDNSGSEIGQFAWTPSDSRVHYWGPNGGGTPVDRGAVTTSVVDEFQLADDVVPGKVLHLTRVRLIAADGKHVDMSSMFALHNAP